MDVKKVGGRAQTGRKGATAEMEGEGGDGEISAPELGHVARSS